uniref:WD repeat domain 1 n=1 Tax=Laticauda laticaudata TaxID=8630 RepID=A0A8C5RV01_LATLA
MTVFASLPQVERGVSKIIGGDPKGNNFLYTNGKSVIIRNIDNPAIADIYTEHAHQVVVAKYAPSGFYIASGDISGKLRIWDTTQKEHLLKYEYQPFAGKIKDIAWTEDSKRIAAVGEGREKFGAVFLWDTGSSVGELAGHNKIINTVDIKQTRPYRLATGSDDNCAAFFEGPPFKFQFTISDHSRFVNCVRFSPDGNRFATASADGQIIIYDGKTGEKIDALGGNKAHDGGIYAISWSPDGHRLLSASGDKTAKIWDVGAQSVVTTFKMGSDVLDQQLGCLWQKDHLLTLSLSGYINYLDKNNPNKPLCIIKVCGIIKAMNSGFQPLKQQAAISGPCWCWMCLGCSGRFITCSLPQDTGPTHTTAEAAIVARGEWGRVALQLCVVIHSPFVKHGKFHCEAHPAPTRARRSICEIQQERCQRISLAASLHHGASWMWLRTPSALQQMTQMCFTVGLRENYCHLSPQSLCQTHQQQPSLLQPAPLHWAHHLVITDNEVQGLDKLSSHRQIVYFTNKSKEKHQAQTT